MVDFHDRRTGIVSRIGTAIGNLIGSTMDMRNIITPINPNAPHPLDNPNSPLARSVKKDPYEPNDVHKMYGMTRNDVKNMHKKYDFSTGFPIAKKDLRRSRKNSPWG